MGWIFYVISIGIGVGIMAASIYNERMYHDHFPIIPLFIMTELFFCIIFLMVWGLYCPENHTKSYTVTDYVEYDIVSAAQSDKISGRFHLLGGYVDETPVYMAYKLNTDGSLSMISMNASTTKIIETDSEKPHIRQYTKGKWNNVKWGFWRRAIYGKENGDGYNKVMYMRPESTGIIYVPVGTIKPTFEGMNL